MHKRSIFNAVFLSIYCIFSIGLIWNVIDANIVAKSMFYTGGVLAFILFFYLYVIKKLPFPKTPKRNKIIATIGAIFVLAGVIIKLYGHKDLGDIIIIIGVGIEVSLLIYSSKAIDAKQSI